MTAPAVPQSHLLELRGISKSFSGNPALDGVDFTLRRGEIHALMGENGAGKSTLIKVLTGVYPRDAGTVMLNSKPFVARSPLEATTNGISTVYQEVNLIPGLSVAENVSMGRVKRWGGRISWRETRQRAKAALERLGLSSLDIDRSVGSYSVAIQQMVAIARAVDVEAKVLILDEPTSSLDEQEVAELFSVMRKLAWDGMGIVFVTHFLNQVYTITDRITVLRNGKLVGSYPTKELPKLELIARMMGREAEHAAAVAGGHRGADYASDTVTLSAQNIGKRGSVGPLDLDIKKGETFGLAGLLGSGRTETVRLLFGLDKADSGQIILDNQPITMRNPRTAVAHGLGFCPEDRKVSGIVPDLSVRDNIILVLQQRRGWWRKISRAETDRITAEMIKALNIKTADAGTPIKFLSGGNQQKAILARWLAAHPKLLILDEPTRGIDVGAKFEIARKMEELRQEGMSILFISSELEEVARSCQRVAVMRDRKKIAELKGADITVGNIMDKIAHATDTSTETKQNHG